MTDTMNLAGILQTDGEPHARGCPAWLPEGDRRDMGSELKVGSDVRVTTALTPDCKPGDRGTLALATLLGDGRWLYHVRLHPPRAGRVKWFYPDEVESAD